MAGTVFRSIRLVALIAIAGAGPLGAQRAPGSKPDRPMDGRRADREHMHRGARPLDALNLSADQKARVEAIHARYGAQLRASHDSARGLMENARALHEREMAEVRSVLTTAQSAKLDSLHRMKPGGRHAFGHPEFGGDGPQGPRGPGAHGAGFPGGPLNLDLTDAQKKQVEAIRAQYRTANEASRNEIRPLMEAARDARQKGDTASARATMAKAREKMEASRSVREKEMAEIRAVLTPDQRAKLDAERDRHEGGDPRARRHRGPGGIKMDGPHPMSPRTI